MYTHTKTHIHILALSNVQTKKDRYSLEAKMSKVKIFVYLDQTICNRFLCIINTLIFFLYFLLNITHVQLSATSTSNFY